MKKLIFSCLIVLIANINFAQTEDPVLMKIAGKNVNLSEFEAIYNKNNNNQNASSQTLEEYLDLYINFKLKVKAAEEAGLDTSKAFLNELQGYRKQLAQPYLSDKEVTEELIKEAYDRLKTDVRAKHILISVDPNALPKDTLKAYNEILKARKRILGGEKFEKVAKEISTDPSAKQNGGDLGYFTALYMVYPFENAAYKTKVGKVSMPIRTKFGYHILQVDDKRPARGTIKVAHIMIKVKNGATQEEIDNAEKKAKEVYAELSTGKIEFAQAANKYSDDKGSSRNGGELPPFGTGRMVEEFETAAFGLKNDGDLSEPIRSPYGFHIIKRLSLEPLAPYDEMYNTLKNKVSRDSRSNKSKEALIARVKKDNNFKENYREFKDFYKVVDESYLEGKWDVNKAKKLNKVIFSLSAANDKLEYTQQDFAKYLDSKQKKLNKSAKLLPYLNKLYDEKVESTILKFEDDRLEKKYPEFKLLMQEYRDGILLFEITDQKVWSKAVKDTAGLNSFYEKNKKNYMWDKRVKASIYTCKDEKIAKKVSKLVKKKQKKNYSNDDILKLVNVNSQLDLNVESKKFIKKENDLVDKTEWTKNNIAQYDTEKGVEIVLIEEVIAPEPKKLNEVRGLITSEYQNHLEKEWVDSLKAKYSVEVNKEVLKKVK